MSKKEMKVKIKRIENRIILLGDEASGKSSFILRYIDNSFSVNYLSTYGIDTKLKLVKLENGEEIKLMLTDTPGQERFKSLAYNFIKKCDGIILLYDITDISSFEGAKEWLKYLRNEYRNSKPIILVGNKIDLIEKREVDKEEGENFAKENDLKFYECSSKTGENVEESVNDLVKTIYDLIEFNKKLLREKIKMEEEESAKKKLNILSKYISF